MSENKEKVFYNKQAPKEWLKTLSQFGTDVNKPYLGSLSYCYIYAEVWQS